MRTTSQSQTPRMSAHAFASALRTAAVLAAAVLLLPQAAVAKPASGKHPIFDNITAMSQTGCPGDPVVFHVDAYDPDGVIVQYEWNFQGGTAWIVGAPDMTWVFAKEKQYNVGIRLTDNDGFKQVDHIKVNVACAQPPADPDNAPPTVVIDDPPTSVTSGTPITLIAFGQDSDGTVVDYDWTFGDGNTGNGQSVQHIFTVPTDAVTVTVTATDDDGATTTAVATFAVTGAPQPRPNGFVDGARLTIRVNPMTGGVEVSSNE